MKALLYLQFRQFVNSIKRITGSAKRLIPAILIVLWLFQSLTFTVLMRSEQGIMRGRSPIPAGLLQVDTVWSSMFSMLGIAVLYIIYNAFSDGLLVFSPSQVDFLFPSPINRRSVLAIKLIGDYIKYLVYSAFAFLFIGPHLYRLFGQFMGAQAVVSWLGVGCLVIFAMNLAHILHLVASAGASRIETAGRAFKLGLVVILGIVVCTGVLHYAKTGDFLLSLVGALRYGLLPVILMPVSWCVDLVVGPMTGTAYSWATYELFGLALLAVGSLFALLARPEGFYEPSLAVSSRLARVRAAARSGDLAAARVEARRGKMSQGGQSSPIPPFGRGAYALLWKSAVVGVRMSGWKLLLMVAAPVGIAAAVGSLVSDGELLHYSPVVLPYLSWFVIAASMSAVRSELRQVEIVKTIPDTGFKILSAQVLGRWFCLVGFIAVMAFSMHVFIPSADRRLLWMLASASVWGGLAAISAGCIVAMAYPDTKDKLAMTLPGCISTFVLMAVIVPTAVIAGVAAATGAGQVGTTAALIIVNVPIAWVTISVAGTMFRNADPND